MAVDFSGQISWNRKVLVPDYKCRCNDKYDSCGDGKNIIRANFLYSQEFETLSSTTHWALKLNLQIKLTSTKTKSK